MKEPIRIPPLLIGKELTDLIAEHNARVLRIWAERGSACKPFGSSRALGLRKATLTAALSPNVDLSTRTHPNDIR